MSRDQFGLGHWKPITMRSDRNLFRSVEAMDTGKDVVIWTFTTVTSPEGSQAITESMVVVPDHKIESRVRDGNLEENRIVPRD